MVGPEVEAEQDSEGDDPCGGDENGFRMVRDGGPVDQPEHHGLHK